MTTHKTPFDAAVITPTYNRATLLPDALESVIAQTTSARIEMAVVDDGSDDDTDAVMAPYLEKYGDPDGKVYLRYTKLGKAGVVAARNTAIEQTTAPLIAFLDSDDYWHPDKLAKQIEQMQDPKVGVVHTSFRYVNEAGELADDGPQRLDNAAVGDCLDLLLHEFIVVFSSVMVRRAIVEKAAAETDHKLPFDPRWTNAQDYDLMLRCARRCHFAYVAKPLTLYRLHGAHGAMGNLKRAFGFHSRVQLDFVKRFGDQIGMDDKEIRRRVRQFLYSRADAQFWRRRLVDTQALCELARELEVYDDGFVELERRAGRPAWVYRVKDAVDRWLGRRRSS